jgi:hypothetical protein
MINTTKRALAAIKDIRGQKIPRTIDWTIKRYWLPHEWEPYGKDFHINSKRLRILISLNIWTIWKTRNQISINGTNLSNTAAANSLTEIIKDIITKQWNSLVFYKETGRERRAQSIRKLWRRLAVIPDTEKIPPTFRF